MATHVSTLTFFNKLIFNRASIRSDRGKTLASHERERERGGGGRLVGMMNLSVQPQSCFVFLSTGHPAS